MSFYSELVLAANDGIAEISEEAVRAVFGEVGLLQAGREREKFCNLSDDITNLFCDEDARRQNTQFFCPDSIGFHRSIEIMGNDMYFKGSGYAISIHGNGYFFPWNADALRRRVVGYSKLRQLRKRLEEVCGGGFVFPKNKPELSERWIDGEKGWMWFMSESL